MKKKPIDIAVISDVHLGTYGCHAIELNAYLKSIHPKRLILNGDIIDIWQFNKRYFPKSHFKVLKTIIKMASNGTEVTYITGNHDEVLRKFSPAILGKLTLIDKVVLDIDGAKTWIFHGDVFDVSIQHSKWLAKIGSYGYDLLILINRLINWMLIQLGRERYSLSKKIKNSFKSAIKFINDFEQTATDLAIDNGYDTVICGHIHQPQHRQVTNHKGSTLYLNSGDWVENLTALEYVNKQWSIITCHPINDKTKVNNQANENIEIPDYQTLINIITNQ